jgi:hypothetical protein
MAGIHLETQFKDLFNTTALPLLDLIMLDEYNSKPDLRPQLFNMESADREIVQNTEIDSLGRFQQVSAGEVAPLDNFAQSYNKTYRMLTYKKMIAITKEMVRDEKWSLINKMVKSIGRSARETQQANAFSVFNNAFSSSFPCSDGVALISASHPSQVGNQSNTLAAQSDLSYTALQEAERVFVNTLDQVGKHLDILPKKLLVNPFNMHTAKETVGSPFAPGSANNNINSVMQYEVAVSPYLTDLDAWFLLAAPEDHGLRIYDRQPLETESDFDKKAHVLYYVGDYREAVGADLWRGIVGSDGSAT